MSDISAASMLSNLLRQSSATASHDAYSAARTGQSQTARPAEKPSPASASDFDSNGTFLRSSEKKGASTLSQAIDFLT